MVGSERIPLFPLHTVLFPGALLPLHVFEQRYRQLVEENRDFGIVLIREGREVGSVPQVHEVGTLARFERVVALPDGRYEVIVRGMQRFRIDGLLDPDPYLRAKVTMLDEPAQEAASPLVARLETYLGMHGLEVAPELSEALSQRLVWLVGAILQVEPAKRQQLLEAGSVTVAEQLLDGELAKLSSMGALAPVPPPGFSPN